MNTLFDHTSIIKTVTNRWGLASLTERDRAATDVSEALALDTPRTDTPELHPHPYTPNREEDTQPISVFQRAFLFTAAAFEYRDEIEQVDNLFEKAADLARLIENEYKISKIKTIGDAVKFITTRLRPMIRRGKSR